MRREWPFALTRSMAQFDSAVARVGQRLRALMPHSCLWQTTSHQRVEVAASVARIWSAAWRIDCSQLEPGAVIRPDPGEWHPRGPTGSLETASSSGEMSQQCSMPTGAERKRIVQITLP